MSKFWTFLKLLWQRATSRVFWFWDFLGAVAPFNPLLPVSIPELDWRASALIYSGVLLASMYLLWRDERTEVEKRDATIARLKDAVPKYEITHGVVRQATVANLIDKYEAEVSNLEAAVAAANAAPAANTLGGGMLAAMQQLTAAHQTIMRVTGTESREEKLERLRGYLAELKEYEHALERTYRVDLFITASRADTNVQIYIEAEKPAIFIEDDDFIEDFMPRQFAPSIYEVGITRRGGHPLEYMPNIRKPRTPDQRGEVDAMSAHLKFINAGNEESIFTDCLYIQSEEPVIKLKVKIHSTNRRNAQHLTVEIPVSSPTIIEVAKAES